jgi:amino acid transporter
MTKKFDPVLLIAIPLLGIVGGGYLSLPTALLTRGKEPWTSMMLAFGLGTMIFLVGHFGFKTTLSPILWSWLAGSIMYLLMASVGGFRQHIEPFFIAHMIAFTCLMGLASVEHEKQEKQHRSTAASRSVSMISPDYNPNPVIDARQRW